MKLYYTNTAKIILMAREFGVRFICYPTKEQIAEYETDSPYDWLHSCPLNAYEINTIEDALDWIDEASGRVYVHPDDYHIFEAQDGDLLKIHNCLAFCRKVRSLDGGYESQLEQILAIDTYYLNDETGFQESPQIYMRNNKAFFMPEIENDTNTNK